MQIKKILPALFKRGSQITAVAISPAINIVDPTGFTSGSIGLLITTTGETIADTLDKKMLLGKFRILSRVFFRALYFERLNQCTYVIRS